MTRPRTLLDKIWDSHVILEDRGQCLLYVDRHLLHDGSAQSFEKLDLERRTVRSPCLTLATADHYVPTRRAPEAAADADAQKMVAHLARNTRRFGIEHYGPGHARQGIAHVIGPELGVTLPGFIVLCGDSHTSTHGAIGAFAFGIGASEVAHVLATQTLWQARPRSMRVTIGGALAPGTSAKDLVLHLIGVIGTGGAREHVVEYAGPVVRALSVEARLTLCNMSIEAGARAGLVAPDDTTLSYLHGRPLAPSGAAWDQAAAYWRTLHSDDDARFDREVRLDAGAVSPTVTWGTSPEDTVSVTGSVPDPSDDPDPARRERRQRALEYMALRAGTRVSDIRVDRVFIGSCANSRIEDLRAAAKILEGRRVQVPTLIVPGSGGVKAQAEAEGLDAIFEQSGAQWREPGCSMCVAINGSDMLQPGERCASTSNRNFAGRQGRGSRTHLMSPATAAATALAGRIADPRSFP
jgi:3-isopropylmalate/(R)-2-methylmalate dehydratase large subunit